jgi:diguanylate cyclase (GGDEF)-like protein
MITLTSQPSHSEPENKSAQFRHTFRAINRKVWWHWWNAFLVIMLLMGTIISLTIPNTLSVGDSTYQIELTSAVRGLLGLVLIFNVYSLYQQYLLGKLRIDLAKQVELTVEQEERADTFHELAFLDHLTGLYNRRYGDEHLRREIARAERTGDPFTVLLLDLDHFKEINDEFGHSAGDRVLQEFAHRLSSAIRGSDIAVRFGGDEFLVILIECPPDKIEIVLSRLRNFEIEMNNEKIPVSCSSGWTQVLPGDTAEDLIKRADVALYAQKKAITTHPPRGEAHSYTVQCIS